MDRSGVAATLASVVIFTTMLVANSAVYSAQNSYLNAAHLSAAQVQERGYATVLLGLSSFSALASAQSLLESTPMDCYSPSAYLSSLAGSAAGHGTSGSLRFSTSSSWSYVAGPSPGEASALLPSQFGGYSAGDLNIELETSVAESYAGGLPSYSVEQSQVVHLGVHPEAMAAACQSALSGLRGSLAAAHTCDPKVVAELASSAGLSSPGSLGDGASVSGSTGRCTIYYWVRMTQTGIEGVSGTFQWSVFGSGSLETSLLPGSTPSGT